MSLKQPRITEFWKSSKAAGGDYNKADSKVPKGVSARAAGNGCLNLRLPQLPRELQLHILSLVEPPRTLERLARDRSCAPALRALLDDRSLRERRLRVVNSVASSESSPSPRNTSPRNNTSQTLLLPTRSTPPLLLQPQQLTSFLTEIIISGVSNIIDATIEEICRRCGRNLHILEVSRGSNAQLTDRAFHAIAERCAVLAELRVSGFMTKFHDSDKSERNNEFGTAPKVYTVDGLIAVIRKRRTLRTVDVSWTRRFLIDAIVEALLAAPLHPTRKLTIDARFCPMGSVPLPLKEKHVDVDDDESRATTFHVTPSIDILTATMQ